MTAKSVLVRSLGLRPRARASTCPPLATSLPLTAYFAFDLTFRKEKISFRGEHYVICLVILFLTIFV